MTQFAIWPHNLIDVYSGVGELVNNWLVCSYGFTMQRDLNEIYSSSYRAIVCRSTFIPIFGTACMHDHKIGLNYKVPS